MWFLPLKRKERKGDRKRDKGTWGQGAGEHQGQRRWGRWGVLKKNTEFRIGEFRIFWLLASI
jgi:hypothetical protein